MNPKPIYAALSVAAIIGFLAVSALIAALDYISRNLLDVVYQLFSR